MSVGTFTFVCGLVFFVSFVLKMGFHGGQCVTDALSAPLTLGLYVTPVLWAAAAARCWRSGPEVPVYRRLTEVGRPTRGKVR